MTGKYNVFFPETWIFRYEDAPFPRMTFGKIFFEK